MSKRRLVTQDPWAYLKKYTTARIALGRVGDAIPTKELLDFWLSYAKAKDAVYKSLDTNLISSQIKQLNHVAILVESLAESRSQYLKRSDLGRQLSDHSKEALKSICNNQTYDIAISVADGLSATAIEENSFKLLSILLPMIGRSGLTLAPIAIVKQGRVAISDDIGKQLSAKLSLILIGERPGLSSPNSMGIYLTYGPTPQNTDERRNCISNVRPQGLSYQNAADQLLYLIVESIRLKISGINLKPLMPPEKV